MKNITLLSIDLTHFDLGSAGATAGEASISTGETEASKTPESSMNESTKSSRRLKKAGEKIVYGKQPSSKTANGSDAEDQHQQGASISDVSVTSDTLEAKRAAFEELISGEYKDMFSDRVQKIIDRRFKQTKELEEQLGQATPILDILRQKYGLRNASPKQILEAVENDDLYWEDAATQAGLTVEQYKYIKKIERENEAMKTYSKRQQAQQKANETYQQWIKQAEQMQEEYPEFDLNEECKNREFLSLLQSGVAIKTAYEVIHVDDIKKSVAQNTAKTVEKNVVNNIRANGIRPAENGTLQSTGIIIKSDVSKLTRKDREAAARAAMRGEKITF